ncbi:AAA family ATPase [Streptomyces chartreusis]|uniref:AAA family ATPase n=1 Tax=Streptomyces chartreusis TaxID=1969 RepID=UPI00364B0A01
MGESRALLLGVSSFSSPLRAGEEPPTGVDAWHPLEFVETVLPQLEQSLRGLGYDVDCHRDPDVHTMRTAVGTSLGTARIVCAVTHGATDSLGDPTRVDAVPSCSTIGFGTNVSEWVSTAQTMRQPTLFLLDLCRSGRAARLPFLLHHAGRDTYAWVIAAAASEEDAYDGRFSTAVAEVLEELARTGLGTSKTRAYIAFSVVARRIRQRVEAMPGIPQTVVATALDQGLDDPLLPFFPNLRYEPDPLESVRESVQASIRPFMDDLLYERGRDAEHFIDRVGTHFAGRRAQLREVADWLDADSSPGLMVVTGSPGVGKSALLSAVVCSAHPRLVEAVPHVRMRLKAQEPSSCPPLISRMAAVHARQRSLPEIVASIADQLWLGKPADGWSAEALVDAITDLAERPVIVLDALDEAVDSTAIAEQLLAPLATATYGERKSRTGPVCRLLIGMRPWDNLHALHRLAQRQGALIDLDRVDESDLRADLTAHLASRLEDLKGYRAGTARRVRNALAAAVATRLIRDAADTPFGAFLVATVFVRSVETLPAAKTEEEALDLAASVPTNLPDLLELDLTSRANPGAVRAVLTAVAHAQGDGVPTEVTSELVPLFHDNAVQDLQALMDECLFYTRLAVDADGTVLYRLFHQGLADYLCGHSRPGEFQGQCPDATALVDRLLASGLVGRDPLTGARSWATTVPYMLRHILSHAAVAGPAHVQELLHDTGFLFRANPDHVLPHLPRARTYEGIGSVYAEAFARKRPKTLEGRRFLLLLTATRRGDASVLRLLRRDSAQEPWQPYRVRPVSPGAGVRSLALADLDGDLVALVADSRARITQWQVEGTYGASRRLEWNQADLVQALACTTLDGHPVAVCCGIEGELVLWDLESAGRQALPFAVGAPVGALDCAQVDGRPAVVAAGLDGSVHIRWLDRGTPIVSVEQAHSGPVKVVACTTLAGQPAAVTAGLDGLLRFWDIGTGQPCAPTVDNGAPVGAIDCVVQDSRAVAVAGGVDGTVRLWDIAASRTRTLREAHSRAVRAVTCTNVEGNPVAVTGTDDGDLWVWDLDQGLPTARMSFPGAIRALDAVGEVILVGCSAEVVVLKRRALRGNELRWTKWAWTFPGAQS